MKHCLIWLLSFVLWTVPASADVFTVTTTDDTDTNTVPMSLRTAIRLANQTPGPHIIRFDIPTSGVARIVLQPQPNDSSDASATLPDIYSTVVIDGYTQPGSITNSLEVGNNAQPMVEIDCRNTLDGYSRAFWIEGSGCLVRGLIINNATGTGGNAAAIMVRGNNNVIAGNWIGVDSTGTARADGPGNGAGIWISGGCGNCIGGTSPDDRNVCSGANDVGIVLADSVAASLGCSNNLVLGNYIGTDITGTQPIPNLGHAGIYLLGAANNVIGGGTSSTKNIIAGNAGPGIFAYPRPGFPCDGNRIVGNYIGISASGDISDHRLKIGNGGPGILLSNTVGTVIGQDFDYTPNEGTANLIVDNGGHGIQVQGASATGNCIRGNRIFQNGGFAIVLGDTPNPVPPPPAGSGPNESMRPPMMLSSKYDGTLNTLVSGWVDSQTPADVKVDFYGMANTDPAAHGAAYFYLGTVQPDASGRFCASLLGDYGSLADPASAFRVTATCTAPNGSTSGLTEPPKYRLKALEVNQSVQDWKNSVTLYKNKKTYVRAFLETLDGTEAPVNLAELRPRLHGWQGGNLVDPLNNCLAMAGLKIPARADLSRITLARNINFALPEAWCDGPIELWFEGQAVTCDACPSCTGCASCGAAVVFQHPPAINLALYNIKYPFPSLPYYRECTYAEMDRVEQLIKAMYPISSRSFFLRASYRISFLWPGNTPAPADVNQSLRWSRILDGSYLTSQVALGLIPGAPGTGTSGFYGLGDWPPAKTASGYFTDTAGKTLRVVPCHELAHELGEAHAILESWMITDNLVRDDLGNLMWAEDRWGNSSPVYRAGCGGKVSTTELSFPYGLPSGEATLGPMNDDPYARMFGLDTSSPTPVILDPDEVFELMSYCGSPPYDRWVSGYTYDHLAHNLEAKYGTMAVKPGRFKPYGGSQQDLLLVRGAVNMWSHTVSLSPFGRWSGSQNFWQPTPGNYQLQLLGEDGTVLFQTSFQPEGGDSEELQPRNNGFMIPVPFNPAYRTARVLTQGLVMATRLASPHAPTLRIDYPKGGETIGAGVLSLKWTAQDGDNDPLTYDVQFSPDGGSSWQTLALDWITPQLDVDSAELPATTQGLIRVVASDGFNTTLADSPAVFTIASQPPRVSISSPVMDQILSQQQQVVFEAFARDTTDGQLLDTNITWVSSLQGQLGTGTLLVLDGSLLQAGNHDIQATAQNSQGLSASASVRIHVGTNAPALYADLALTIQTPSFSPAPGSSFLVNLVVQNSGRDDASQVQLSNTVPAGLSLVSATASQGMVQTDAAQVVANLGTVPADQTATLALQFQAASSGAYTIQAGVTGTESDPNPANNLAVETIQVIESTPALPNLQVSMTLTNEPVFKQALGYIVSVQNAGAATATQVQLTNVLAPGAVLLSAATSQGSWSINGNLLVAQLGTIPAQGGALLYFTVQPTSLGPLCYQASVGSAEPDADPWDNSFSSIVTVTLRLAITAIKNGSDLNLEWDDAPNLFLEQTDQLGPAALWEPAPGTPVLDQGRWHYPVPPGGLARFYRLRLQQGL
jgi:uncharacterized repeat protein (TIGR01451 family)